MLRLQWAEHLATYPWCPLLSLAVQLRLQDRLVEVGPQEVDLRMDHLEVEMTTVQTSLPAVVVQMLDRLVGTDHQAGMALGETQVEVTQEDQEAKDLQMDPRVEAGRQEEMDLQAVEEMEMVETTVVDRQPTKHQRRRRLKYKKRL